MQWTTTDRIRTFGHMTSNKHCMTDSELVAPIVAAVLDAGTALVATRRARPTTGAEIRNATAANDAVAMEVLRPALLGARPSARFVDDELGGGLLPPGEWWVVDPVEGNINLVQGSDEWGVSVSLVRDNIAVLTVVGVPVTGQMYTAVRGHGAMVNDRPLAVSTKVDLSCALVSTGQAKPGETDDVHRLLGESVTTMLGRALLVRVSVPSTWQLLAVASGAMDAFWQYSCIRSGLVAGALLVEESGGVVTDVSGRPWTLASESFVASSPGIHAAVVNALSRGVVQHDVDGAS
jgi:myo-inositol-1(or 4)-monophosphatase